MSEITTGSVSIPMQTVSTPSIGEQFISTCESFANYCEDEYQKLLDEVQQSDELIQRLNEQLAESPIEAVENAGKLKNLILNNVSFNMRLSDMDVKQKEFLASSLAIENSPLKKHSVSYLEKLNSDDMSFRTMLSKSSMDLAETNMSNLQRILQQAAHHTGFTSKTKVIKQGTTLKDVVFVDNQNRRFTAYSKLDKNLNPTLALDLEGFGCDSNECSSKMNEIIAYLNEKGIPFKYKRLKHNQPEGMLRNILKKKENKQSKKTEVADYLNQSSDTINNSQKRK